MREKLHSGAISDYAEAFKFYWKIDPELGEKFFTEIEKLLQQVCEDPFRFRIYRPPARRHLSHKFPCGVIFVVEDDSVLILAIKNLHREDAFWTSRLTD